ncbi:MAG: Crp/Fnr family transcriptional regulator [Chloroflexi bacterium]|nr:Crp/Fnr family transcriptional regulator [Chloroflexota bacterium]
MPNNILLKRLQAVEYLRGLDDETLGKIAIGARWKVFAADAVVFWEGDSESNLYYLQYGLLKVLKASPDGREQVLRHISAGEIFNEVGVLAKRPNPATAVALEESGVWLIPRQSIEEVLLANPKIALQIIESMADKFIDLISLAADLSLKSVKARFAKLLLGQADGDLIERGSWATPTEMAARLGTVPDVLSRVIRELTKAGIIEMDKHHFRILDREELKRQAMIQGK